MYIFNNSDKDPWLNDKQSDNPISLKRGQRILISGPPHSGKSLLLKNLLVNTPNIDEIFIKRSDENSEEFSDLTFNSIDSFRDLTNINVKSYKDKLCVLIFEDFNNISKKDEPYIEKFLSFYASHWGWIVIICSQTPYQLPINSIRRLIDIFFFAGKDTRFLNAIPMSNEKRQKIKDLSSKSGKHDFIKIDTPDDKYYLNGKELDI